MVLRYSDRLFEGGSSGWFSVRQLYFPAYPAGRPILPSQVERSIDTAVALSNVFVYYDTGRALGIFPPKVLIIDSIGGTFCINMDHKLANPASSSMTTAQIPRPDKCRSGKSNFLLGVHVLLRSISAPPSTEYDAAASDIVRVVKEYLNEMPYWRDHWEPPTVNQEFVECIYDELAAKNWDLSPQYLRATVHLMATMTEVTYFFYPLCLSAEHCQLVYLGLTWEEKRTITIFTWLAYFSSRWA